MGLQKILILLNALRLRCFNGRQLVLCCIANIASIGGNELQFRLIASGLKERKISKVAITMGEVKIDNISINHMRKQGVTHLAFGQYFDERFFAIIFRILGAKIIQIFNPASAALIPSAKRAGLRIIYMETGIPIADDRFWHPIKPYIKDIDFLISVSKCALINLQTQFGYKGPAKTIPSMIEPPPAGRYARPPVVNQCHIIYFGRLCPTKQLDQLVKAFSLVHKKLPFARLTFIGDGDVRTKLQDEVKNLNLMEYVTWRNWLPREALFAELSQADIFCLPSKSEGSPCSIAEAMSIGLSVIATNVGGIPETVMHRKTGLLVAVNDIESLATAIIELAQYPQLRLELGKQGNLYYHQRRTQQQIFTELLAIYQQLILCR